MARLPAEEARRRFAAARVARLATVSAAGLPHLVPVVFAVRDDLVVFAVDQKPKRSADVRRVRNIADNPHVCLLADEYADDWSRLWWARADGTATVVQAGPSREGALELLLDRYEQYRADPPRGPVVVVTVTRWSGWAHASGG
ncbi:TIGR03668 family PPOX class F420-dependent oxidoreductase [Thermoactinospora rubra]|uniref:TIGR03668 family PPOX class F420-dependent oxidoreductase n=1 Tax=Thermoactinospora rubra TaxID=1088767 RepID=UPI000A1094B8|nr:TIGR03668 family PPOX class F420-dependent oxidoreductase [Thermoactinospora rubra]